MTQVGQKTEAGTIPKELGRLSNWKHVVFGEFVMATFSLIIDVTLMPALREICEFE